MFSFAYSQTDSAGYPLRTRIPAGARINAVLTPCRCRCEVSLMGSVQPRRIGYESDSFQATEIIRQFHCAGLPFALGSLPVARGPDDVDQCVRPPDAALAGHPLSSVRRESMTDADKAHPGSTRIALRAVTLITASSSQRLAPAGVSVYLLAANGRACLAHVRPAAPDALPGPPRTRRRMVRLVVARAFPRAGDGLRTNGYR
jgi:hypothetical protein